MTDAVHPRLRLERVPFLHPDAQRLVAEVQQEYVRRYGSPDDTPLEPGFFDAPDGTFVVAYLTDAGARPDGAEVPVATGAWRRRNDVQAVGTTATAEIKRMYVAPSARGRGAARAVLAHLEATAREAGAEATVLETGLAQPEAIALYGSAGYVPTAGFGHYVDEPLSRCFAKRLVPGEVPAPVWHAVDAGWGDHAAVVLRGRAAAEAGHPLPSRAAPAPEALVRWVLVLDELDRPAACGGVTRDGRAAEIWIEPHARDAVVGEGAGAEHVLAAALGADPTPRSAA